MENFELPKNKVEIPQSTGMEEDIILCSLASVMDSYSLWLLDSLWLSYIFAIADPIQRSLKTKTRKDLSGFRKQLVSLALGQWVKQGAIRIIKAD